ncbi:MAG: response regulator transcription factor [Synergistes sp.]|nr:response regulator transcription factor [Synergistes sp.]
MKKKILLASPDTLLADALAFALENNDAYNFEVSKAEYEDLFEIRSLIGSAFDVIVVCVKLQFGGAVQILKEIVRTNRKKKFVFIFDGWGADAAEFVNSAGGAAIITGKADIKDFFGALFAVINGERFVKVGSSPDKPGDGDILRHESVLISSLTNRERGILYLVARGLTNKEISRKLVISEKTVKNHVSSCLKKLEVSDRTKAAVIAWEEGLPQIPEEFFENPSSLFVP